MENLAEKEINKLGRHPTPGQTPPLGRHLPAHTLSGTHPHGQTSSWVQTPWADTPPADTLWSDIPG